MRDGWSATTLDGIADVIMGQSPDGKSYNQEGKGLPFMQGSAEFGEHNPVPQKWCSDPKKIAEPGDLLLSVRAPVGDTNFADKRIAVGRGLSIIRANKESLNEFIRLVIQLNVAELIASSGSGMFASITGKNLKEFKVNLPTLPEQKRIVDLISSVDSYIEALQQQLESSKKSRNAVLHELLTAGGEGWLRAGLSEICTMIKRGQAPSYTEQKSVTVLNQKCVRNGRIQFEFARQTDSNIKPINEWAYLTSDDTLVNSTGVGTLGRVAFVGTHDEPLTVDSHLTIVRPDKNKIQPSFLGLSLHFREADIEGLAAGSSGQTELSREALGNLIITIPPLPEQKRIVEIIASLDKVANQTQLSITESQNLRSGLLSDLLSGEHEIPASYDKVIGAA
jgi:type I restriction enzyme S subunit